MRAPMRLTTSRTSVTCPGLPLCPQRSIVVRHGISRGPRGHVVHAPHLLGSCEDDCGECCAAQVTRHTLLVRIYCRAVWSGNAGGMWTCMSALRRVYLEICRRGGCLLPRLRGSRTCARCVFQCGRYTYVGTTLWSVMPILFIVECPGPGEHSALGHNAEPVIPTVYTVISLKTSERIRLLVGCSGLSVRPKNQVSHAGLPVGYLTPNLQSPEMLT